MKPMKPLVMKSRVSDGWVAFDDEGRGTHKDTWREAFTHAYVKASLGGTTRIRQAMAGIQ